MDNDIFYSDDDNEYFKKVNMRYYKILKGTETFNRVKILLEKGTQDSKVAVDLIEELGFDNGFKSHDYFSGGPISGFKADKVLPGFKWSSFRKNGIMYKDIKANKTVLDRIKSLPGVTKKEICDALGFEYAQFIDREDGTQHIAFMPGYDFTHEDYYLLKMDGTAVFKVTEDTIEITYTEMKELQEAKHSLTTQ